MQTLFFPSVAGPTITVFCKHDLLFWH